MLGDLEWHRFANGDFATPVRVCRLSRDLTLHLRAGDDRVLIHPKTAPKLVNKHKLEPRHLPMMALAIQLGTVVQDRDRTLSFLYEDDIIFGKIFHLAMKMTGAHHEVWVATFHKLTIQEFNRRLRRATILRRQHQE